MFIESISISNYKSIRSLELDCCDTINVIIGENNVGKSNLFSAIEWLIGPTYPSFNRISKSDYFCGDDSSRISISLLYSDGHRLSMDEEWQSQYGLKRGLHLDDSFVSDDVRNRYVSAFVDTNRRIADNPAGNQWSLLGRLLLEFNKRFDEETIQYNGALVTKSEAFKAEMERVRDDLLFSITDDQSRNLMASLKKILQEETARQLNYPGGKLDIDLNIYDPWNFFKTLQILVTDSSNGLVFRASDLGMGVQASLTIAILRAYADLKLKKSTPIFIDEPELYLHPQARRSFFKVIQELGESGTQVFLTTHSTEFLPLDDFRQIVLLRKDACKGTYPRVAKPERFVQDFEIRTGRSVSEESLMGTYKYAFENTGDSQKAAEALFARKIVLVEGESESLILPYCFSKAGFDYTAEGVTVVRCGGKNELDRFYRLYSEFGIPCYILFDGDKQNEGTADEQRTVNENRAITGLFGDPIDFPRNVATANYLGFETRLEENLGIGQVGKSVKGLKLYIAFRDAVESGKASVPQWVSLMIEKIRQMPKEAESVLRTKEECLGEVWDLPF